MNVQQRAVSFRCRDDMLYGVLSIPGQRSSRGVLVVVGGPQYRAGSHRQFTLLARHLASHGTAVLRFDYRGRGDSEGEVRTFENIGDDIRHAIDQFQVQVPEVREVVLWGLCDAASAALFYAHRDARVAGLVLLNPWVRTEQGAAKTYLKHYYVQRLFTKEFWGKAARFRLDAAGSIKSFLQLAAQLLPNAGRFRDASPLSDEARPSLPLRMLDGFRRFHGPVLLILSGNDLTAKEFLDCTNASQQWTQLLDAPRVQILHLANANHTFARQEWRDEVAESTKEWLASW